VRIVWKRPGVVERDDPKAKVLLGQLAASLTNGRFHFSAKDALLR
jgi:hypothetical protein